MSEPMTKDDLVKWLDEKNVPYEVNDAGQITVKSYLGKVFRNWVNNQGYTSLPDELVSVKGDLWLEDTQIESLGGLISVGGLLDLRGPSITSLGGLTSVGGWLDLRGTPITNLGGLTAVKDLILRGMKNSYFDLSPIESGKCKVDILSLGEDTLHLLTQAIVDKVSQVDYRDKDGLRRTLSTEEVQEIVERNEYNKAKESAVDTIDDSYMDDLRDWGER